MASKLTNHQIDQLYGGRLRLRVCGFCIKNERVLLLKHHSKLGDLWLPPGGGLEYGELISEALKREFLEETCLVVELESFVFATEFLKPPLHAIELFYQVAYISGTAQLGTDPESDAQLLLDLKWLTLKEIQELPEHQKHQCLQGNNFIKLSEIVDSTASKF